MEKSERIAIKSSNNKRIVIKPFDKRRKIANVGTKDYVNEYDRQLRNTKYYTILDTNDTQKTTISVYQPVHVMYVNKHINLIHISI